jgi:NADH-quinone oxidoreductase subunit E
MPTTDDLRLAGFSGAPDELISLLQHYQAAAGYISAESVRQIASWLKISEASVYGVASFYAQFHFEKPGENIIRICLGTACHVQGGALLAEEIQTVLGIAPGEVTPDGRFELQQVACLGCCAQAPLVEINGRIFGKMTPDTLRKVIQDHGTL